MKRTLSVVLCTMLFAGAASGQSLEEKYKKKLEKDFIKKVTWLRSLDEAMAQSKSTGKPIFGYFSRSYAP